MTRRILVIQGHPDRQGAHYGHALAAAYAEGASLAGHEVRTVTVAELEFALLPSRRDFEQQPPSEGIRRAQEDILWAEHLVIFFPLWLGSAPALFKGFLEQVLRPGFGLGRGLGKLKGSLRGRSARLVVTMGMPAALYRWYFGAAGLKSLKQGALGLCGIRPVRESLIGMVEAGAWHRRRWLRRMRALGLKGR